MSQLALKKLQPTLLARAQPWGTEHLACGQRCADNHTAVHAYHLPSPRTLDGGRDSSERDVPAACPVQFHAIGLSWWDRPGPAEPNPADLGDEDLPQFRFSRRIWSGRRATIRNPSFRPT